MFDNKFTGKECIVFGSGPSLNDWDDTQIPSAIRLTCNTCIFSKNIKVHDYFFIQDTGNKHSSRSYNEPFGYVSRKMDYDKFKPKVKKYYGIGVNGRRKKWSLSIKDAEDGDAETYYLYRTKLNIPDKISFMESVVFTMVQFAVKNNCKKIYIVGCDGIKGSRYNEPNINVTEQDRKVEVKWKRQWRLLYQYMDVNNVTYCNFSQPNSIL